MLVRKIPPISIEQQIEKVFLSCIQVGNWVKDLTKKEEGEEEEEGARPAIILFWCLIRRHHLLAGWRSSKWTEILISIVIRQTSNGAVQVEGVR